MVATTHQIFGFLVGLITISIFNFIGFMPTYFWETILFFLFVLFGSLLPDFDNPKSKLGRKVPFLSYPMYWLFGHRTFTHSLLFVIITWMVTKIIVVLCGANDLYTWAITSGVLSHIMGDMVTKKGVPLFYPMKKNIRFFMTFKTGGTVEKLVAVFLVILNIYLFISYIKKGWIHI